VLWITTVENSVENFAVVENPKEIESYPQNKQNFVDKSALSTYFSTAPFHRSKRFYKISYGLQEQVHKFCAPSYYS